MASISNPLSPIIWVTIAGAAATNGFAVQSPAHGFIIGLGYLLGTLTWAIAIALALCWGRRFAQPHFLRWWNAASGVLLGGYGLHLVWLLIVRVWR